MKRWITEEELKELYPEVYQIFFDQKGYYYARQVALDLRNKVNKKQLNNSRYFDTITRRKGQTHVKDVQAAREPI
jgi:hypothetical protein